MTGDYTVQRQCSRHVAQQP